METTRREALLGAVLEELRRHGYWEMSDSRARASVGVSTEEFASEFRSKDECLIAAFDLLTAQALEDARGRCEATESWPGRIGRGLERVLGELAARPDVARAMFHTFPEMEPRAYERFRALLSRFSPFLREGRNCPGAFEGLPPEVETFALGAAKALILREVGLDRTETLPRMLPEILFSILVPFLGPDRAREEMREAARDRGGAGVPSAEVQPRCAAGSRHRGVPG